VLLLSPAGAGPFDTAAWRIGYTAQLVEGGNSGPYWLVSPPARAGERLALTSLVIGSAKPHQIAASVILLAAVLGESTSDILEPVLVRTTEPGGSGVEMLPISPENASVLERYATGLAGHTRVGAVILEPTTVLSPAVLSALRSMSVELSTFTQPL
jgi:hypothetical protein